MDKQVSSFRRPYQSEPGDSLLLPGNPIEAGFTYAHYQRATGVPHEHLASSTMVAVPIPVRPEDGFGETPRWPTARPELMWHPLMWLPHDVASRAEFDGRTETLDEFALRVAIQVTESSLYDPASGTWLDVLAVGGLDVDDPADVERVRLWLSGGPDALLDGLSETVGNLLDMRPEVSPELADHLEMTLDELQTARDEYDPLYAHRSARDSLQFLSECGYAMAAEAMLDALDDLALGEVGEPDPYAPINSPEYVWKPGSRKSLTVTFIRLTRDFLNGAEHTGALEALESQVQAFDGTDDQFLNGPISAFREVLELVRHLYQGSLDELYGQGSAREEGHALTELAADSATA
ncbi:hypothetical protein [Ornithinimicrobium murale]|uniref:hypothetical protein n=1 Tax=Ornithinimicrobium murale TaxID=1050153 RepID=UPI000E0D1E85|nr:hypothetical protein [Ornithinimicrobium murale]